MSIDIINRLVNHKVLGVSGDQTTYQYDIVGDLFVSGDIIVSGGFFSGASNDYVPYVGAGKNVDLGAKNLVTTGSLYGGSVYGVTGSFSGSLYSLDILGQDISGTNVYASQLCGSVGTQYTPSGLWLESGAYILSGPGLAGSSFNTSGAGVTYAGSFYGLAGSITGSLYATDIEGIDISGTNVYASQLCGSVGTDYTPSGLWLESGTYQTSGLYAPSGLYLSSGAYIVSGPVFTGSVYGVISGATTSYAGKLYGNEMLISGTIGNTIISGNLLVNDNDFNVSGGKVGIGTATPDVALDVTGALSTTGQIITSGGLIATGYLGRTLSLSPSSATIEASNHMIMQSVNSYLSFKAPTNSVIFQAGNAANEGARFYDGSGVNIQASFLPNVTEFNKNVEMAGNLEVSGTAHIVGSLIVDNRVGIGTAVPGDTLTVSGTCHISQALTLGSTAVPTPAEGMMYHNAGSNMIYAYLGGAWAAIA